MKQIYLLDKQVPLVGIRSFGVTTSKKMAKEWRDFDSTNCVTIIPVVKTPQDFLNVVLSSEKAKNEQCA